MMHVETPNLLRKPTLGLELESGDALDVREFVVTDALSELFRAELTCVGPSPDIDLDTILGRRATFSIRGGLVEAGRAFVGVVSEIVQQRVETAGLSTYRLVIVPELWLLTQTRAYRVFQQLTDPDIALAVLQAWSVSPAVRLGDTYKERRYRVQYGESDFVFFSRLLEDAGVTFLFDTSADGASALALDDAPHTREARPPLPYVQTPNESLAHEFVTRVELTRDLRPGRYTLQDLDYRRPPAEQLARTSSAGLPTEQAIERHHFRPGAFSFRAPGGDTPIADDRGAQRTDLELGAGQVQKRLDALRGDARTCTFVTSAIDVRPGALVSFTGHPKAELGPAARLFVTKSVLSGTATGTWMHTCQARFADTPYRPALATPKPKTRGVESATVVGPAGDEIHTDEMGRVRVQFHWDRSGTRSETSSLWIPVNQPWGGTGFGALNIPRIGQEVLVDFLGADPDRPVVTGRVFTQTNPVPYKVPAFKDLQAIRSASTPKLPPGVARAGMLGGKTAGGGEDPGAASPQTSPLGGGLPMTAAKIAELVTGSGLFQAVSADAQTHGWQGSELSMHDVQGQEKMYLQAQKDMHTVVKNHQRGVVGHSRSSTVGTDSIREVGNKESFRIGADRSGRVGGDETVRVSGPITMVSMEGEQRFVSAEAHGIHAKEVLFISDETFDSEAKRHFISSDQLIILAVGTSTAIIMFNDGIVIQGDDVLINPGTDAAQAIAAGQSIRAYLEEKEAAEAAAARAERTRTAAIRAWEEMNQEYGERHDQMKNYLDDEGLEDWRFSRFNNLYQSYGGPGRPRAVYDSIVDGTSGFFD